MRQILDRLERLEKICTKPEPMPCALPEGERLLDNFDLCQLLNVSKRTLQRYRSSGDLPYQRIYQKTYYKESDVQKFVDKHFGSFRKMKKKL